MCAVRRDRRYRWQKRGRARALAFLALLTLLAALLIWPSLGGLAWKKALDALEPAAGGSVWKEALDMSSPLAGDANAGAISLDALTLVNWKSPLFIASMPRGLVKAADRLSSVAIVSKPEMYIDPRAADAAREMFLAARSQGLDAWILVSAYRSNEYQRGLYANKLKKEPDYGQDPYAVPVSVMPEGRSEHVTGLALDITCQSHPEVEDTFADTPEGQWLAENCWDFGFILRYPRDKQSITGVVYEPWHLRFVGKEHAPRMRQENLCLEEYVERLE